MSGTVTRVWKDSSPHKVLIDNHLRTEEAINDEMCNPMNGGIHPVENSVITKQKLSNDASGDVLPSSRHLDGNHHTGLQTDDTTTSTIPSRYWGTTYWTPIQI